MNFSPASVMIQVHVRDISWSTGESQNYNKQYSSAASIYANNRRGCIKHITFNIVSYNIPSCYTSDVNSLTVPNRIHVSN